MTTEDMHQTIGALKEAVTELKADMRELRASQARMEATLAKAQGAWRALLGVAGLSSALTAGAFKLWGVLKGGVP